MEVRDFKKRIMDNLRSQGLSTCQAFCVDGCPIHQDNRSWLYLFREGKIKMALDGLLNFNPLPSSTSRVCPKFCEKEANQFCGIACLGKSADFKNSISSVERYLGDFARQHRYKRYKSPIFRKEKIAIIGAGPAGLSCAYQLWHMGFSATIFEKMEKPGGILYFGISEVRLPNEILFDEIRLHLGEIEIRTEAEINSQNFRQFNEYDAIVIATGHSSSKKLDIPGENLPQVLEAIDFLSKINLQSGLNLQGKEVLVIGGGETAIEVANAAIEFGGKAKIIYRKGPENLGCSNGMVDSLKARGGEIEFNLVPREIQKNPEGKLEVKFERFAKEKLAMPDFISKESDFIIIAIGQKPQFGSLPYFIQEKIQNKDFDALEFSGIFVAGDLYYGQKNVAQAISSGNDTAGKIYRFIEKK